MKLLNRIAERRQAPRPTRQGGIANILIALLVGMGLTATVAGTAAYIRGSQEQSLTAHGQIQAQLKAWTGAEVVRQYLAQMQSAGTLPQLASAISTSLPTGLTLTFDGVGGITAVFTAVDSVTLPTVFTARITGTTAAGSRAESKSTIEAVFSAAGSSKVVAPLTFIRNLKLGGSVTVQKPTGSTAPVVINVRGDISTSGNTITGVDILNSTGSINIDSSSTFSQLNSNCDVVLSGSVTAVSVNALRNICMTANAATSGTAVANGSILALSDYTRNGTLSALTNPNPVATCLASGSGGTGSTASTCMPPVISGVDLSFDSAGAKIVNTNGHVTLAQGTIGEVNAQRNLTVSGNGAVNTGKIGGTLSKPGYNNNVNVTTTPGYAPTITPAGLVTVPTNQFNAYTLRSLANYAFSFDAAGYPKVVVQNVNGIANGTYYLGKYRSNQLDYLCSAITANSSTASPDCQGPVSGGKQICQGYSAYNTCFNNGNGAWAIATSASIVPGIAWFEGNLTLTDGKFYNTFIATGNITTNANVIVYAPNYAGYNGTAGGVTYAPTGICVNSYFPGLYPTQLCNTATTTFDANAASGLGNYAFLAGSWSGASYAGQASYVGGNVTIGASSIIRGSIKAGNEFNSSGAATISGAVTALDRKSVV